MAMRNNYVMTNVVLIFRLISNMWTTINYIISKLKKTNNSCHKYFKDSDDSIVILNIKDVYIIYIN